MMLFENIIALLLENDLRSDLENFKKFLISACVLEQQFCSQTTKMRSRTQAEIKNFLKFD